jgi:hypothetical protein
MKVTFTDVPLSHFAGRNPRGALIQTKQGKRILAMAQRAMALGGSVHVETRIDDASMKTSRDQITGTVYERITATIDTSPEPAA